MSRTAHTAVLAVLVLLTSCDRGDWFPLERTAREVLLAWDMWDTDAVRPYEHPMPAVPEGVVSIERKMSFEEARAAVQEMDEKTRTQRAMVTYRRYCHHCHGLNGDGRIIVGESFSPAVPDLRTHKVQGMTDEEIFEQLSGGTEVMIPLDSTLTPLEMVLAIERVRDLVVYPSKPYFKPRSTKPLQ